MRRVIYINNSEEGKMIYKRERENLFKLLKYTLYFASRSSTSLYKTKLNKLLFYTQFLFYKNNENKLLENEFIYDYHGPAIPELDRYLTYFSQMKFIRFYKTAYGFAIEPRMELDDSSYTDGELSILNRVLKKFDGFTSAQISDYSHKEPLWSDEKIKEIISIERAQEINDF